MKEKLKEFWYCIEDKLRQLCGEITPDKRITVILIMLLVFTVLSLYFSISSIYNWGKESERRKQMQIEHIRQLELDKRQRDYDEFIDSEIEKRLFDLYQYELEQDSIDDVEFNKQKMEEYGKTNSDKLGPEAKA
jgi:hypothetical protein